MTIGGVDPSRRNDDVPHNIPQMRTDESMGTEASAQEVNAPEPLPALNFIRADAPLKCLEDLGLPRLAHGFILTALDCHANVQIDREQDVLDGDEAIPRGK